MNEKKFYDIGVMLAKNARVKEMIEESLIDLHHLNESVGEHEVSGNDIMNVLSVIQTELNEALTELIVEEDPYE